MVPVLLSLLVLASTEATPPALDAPAPIASSNTQTAGAAERSRKVCRHESIPNSRFTTKVCKTAAEWEEEAEKARQAFGEVQGRPTVSIQQGN